MLINKRVENLEKSVGSNKSKIVCVNIKKGEDEEAAIEAKLKTIARVSATLFSYVTYLLITLTSNKR